MDCCYSDHTLFWDSHCPSYLLLVEVLLEFCSLKAAGISTSQPPGQRKFLGLFHFGLVSFLSVDSKEILLFLDRHNPALTHLQSLNIEWFYEKDRNGSYKMSIFASWFSVLAVIPIWGLY